MAYWGNDGTFEENQAPIPESEYTLSVPIIRLNFVETTESYKRRRFYETIDNVGKLQIKPTIEGMKGEGGGRIGVLIEVDATAYSLHTMKEIVCPALQGV